jgi:hypothetical protein
MEKLTNRTSKYCLKDIPHLGFGSKQQGAESIMVWCGIRDTKVIGPFCFTGTIDWGKLFADARG